MSNGTSGEKLCTASARELRALAEAHDGLRDEGILVLVDHAGTLQLKKTTDPRDPSDRHLIQLDTRSSVKNRRRLEAVTVKLPGGEVISALDRYDALFWSESAVEKFFFPYYSSIRVLGEGVLEKIMNEFRTNPRIIGFFHMPPTTPKMIQDPIDSIGALMVDAKGKGTEMTLRSFMASIH